MTTVVITEWDRSSRTLEASMEDLFTTLKVLSQK